MRGWFAVLLSVISFTALADGLIQEFDKDVLIFMQEKITEVEGTLKTYHAAVDRLSEKPVGAYEDFFDVTKFKTFPQGIKQRIRELRYYTGMSGVKE